MGYLGPESAEKLQGVLRFRGTIILVEGVVDGQEVLLLY
jgi:hypothetical protein